MNLTDLAEAFRTATDGIAKAKAKEALAAAVRITVVATIRSRVPGHVADDLAQDVTTTVVGCIERGQVTAGKEEQFTGTCARTAIPEYYRRRSRQARLQDALATRGEEPASPDDPESAFANIEYQTLRRAKFDAVNELMKVAPERYRRVLTEVYLKGRSIEEIADEELAADRRAGTPGSTDPDAAARARNRVDQWLTRARRWLALRAYELSLEKAN